jgi:hypothetical protein
MGYVFQILELKFMILKLPIRVIPISSVSIDVHFIIILCAFLRVKSGKLAKTLGNIHTRAYTLTPAP